MLRTCQANIVKLDNGCFDPIFAINLDRATRKIRRKRKARKIRKARRKPKRRKRND